jgi:hypothetical protein
MDILNPKMTEDELGALCEDWITNAKHFDENDLEKLARRPTISMTLVDIEQPNRSKVVSSDVADVMGWILPDCFASLRQVTGQ